MDNNDYINQWRLMTNNFSPVEVEINGIKLLIPNGVFNPSKEITFSSSLLLKHLPKKLDGKRILDMGTGSGIIAIDSEKKNAKSILAIDVHQKSVKTAYNNSSRNNCINISFIWSDLFNNLVGGQYDFIFANLPILDVDFEHVYFRLLNQYENYLTEKGELWIVFASFGDMSLAIKHFEKHPNLKEKIKISKLNVDWYLYKLIK